MLRKELDYSLQQITNSAGGVVTRVLFVSDSVGQFTNTDALRVRVFESIQNSFVPITPSAMNLALIYEPEIYYDDTYMYYVVKYNINYDLREKL